MSFAFLGGSLVANDGLVPVESARWGRFRGCIPADHLDEIGQIGGLVDRFDYRRFYLELAEFIGDEGLCRLRRSPFVMTIASSSQITGFSDV